MTITLKLFTAENLSISPATRCCFAGFLGFCGKQVLSTRQPLQRLHGLMDEKHFQVAWSVMPLNPLSIYILLPE